MPSKGSLFKRVPGWPGYRVSANGVVQSCRTNGGQVSDVWTKRVPSRDKDGYLRLALHKRGASVFVGVHSLVLLAFVGPPNPNQGALHCNDRKTDNRLENLYWGTAKDNAADRARNGNSTKGEGNGNCKITDVEVKQMRDIREQNGTSYEKIAGMFGASKRQTMRICKYQVRLEAPKEVPVDRAEVRRMKRSTAEQQKFIRRALRNGIALHVIEEQLDAEDNREDQKVKS